MDADRSKPVETEERPRVIDPRVIPWVPIRRVIVGVLATLAALWALYQMRALVAMMVISVFFSLALEPGVRWLASRYGWKRGSYVGGIYLAGLVVPSGNGAGSHPWCRGTLRTDRNTRF